MKKYVLVGASFRAFKMYANAIVNNYKDVAKIVGIFDINKIRADYVRKNTDPEIPVFTDFDEMMRQTRPDTAIITTVDRYHHEYIIKSFEYGCDAITEKPMTIDEEKCNAILDAERKYGRKVTVTFNLRFSPYAMRIKELIKEGAVGEVLSVNFDYLLDTVHGPSLFRRWNRIKENSGGLLISKSTHHFDLVNWWIDEEPEEVYANGTLRVYGPNRDKKGERCSTCQYANECEYVDELSTNPDIIEMYHKASVADGYYKDSCIFDKEINIEDSMSVNVKYSKGTLLTYSLITYSPYEGWKVAINGTNGRLEAQDFLSGQRKEEPFNCISVYNRKGEVLTYKSKKIVAGHGGGDERLLRMLMGENLPDPLGSFADSYAGANSLIIGACANKSMKEKRPFFVKDLLQRKM